MVAPRRRFLRAGSHVIAVAIALLAPAAASAATFHAPASTSLGARITATASGVKPGRYTLVLVKVLLAPKGVATTACVAPVGAATARNGQVTISGKLPSRLSCHQGEGETLGTAAVKPGHYLLDIGGFEPPAGFNAQTFLKRSINITLVSLRVQPALSAPARARLGGRVAARASGLKPGRYTLVLVVVASRPPGGHAVVCDAAIASGTARSGRLSLVGTLPSRLTCSQGGSRVGSIATAPGPATLALGGFSPPDFFSTRLSYLRRAIRLVA
jgi:hypothetical protein